LTQATTSAAATAAAGGHCNTVCFSFFFKKEF